MKTEIVNVDVEPQFRPFNLVIGVESQEELEQLILLSGSPLIDGALRKMGYPRTTNVFRIVTDEIFHRLIGQVSRLPLDDDLGAFNQAIETACIERATRRHVESLAEAEPPRTAGVLSSPDPFFAGPTDPESLFLALANAAGVMLFIEV